MSEHECAMITGVTVEERSCERCKHWKEQTKIKVHHPTPRWGQCKKLRDYHSGVVAYDSEDNVASAFDTDFDF